MTAYPPYYPPPAPEPPKRKKGYIHWAWMLPAAVAFIFIGIVLEKIGSHEPMAWTPPEPTSVGATPSAAAPVRAAPTTAQAPAGADLSRGIPDGDWEVPKEVQPGRYRSTGAQAGLFEFCQVTTKDAKGNILEWETANADEPILVTVTDKAVKFENSNCEPFVKVG